MSEAPGLGPVAELLRDLTDWCRAERVPVVVIGRVAASLLGRPRLTRDVDAVVLLGDLEPEIFVASGQAWGFRPRAADAIAFARATRVVLLTHSGSGLDLDLSLGALPFEEQMAARALAHEWRGYSSRCLEPRTSWC